MAEAHCLNRGDLIYVVVNATFSVIARTESQTDYEKRHAVHGRTYISATD